MIEKFAVQLPDDDRLSLYKSIVREELAKRNSIFFCLPTVYETEKFFKLISSGIENHSLLLHGDISGKKISLFWKESLKKNIPVVIVATPKFLSLPREDIRTLVVEHESSASYYSMTRPHVDIRKFAEVLSERRKIRFILGDSILRVETLHRLNSGELIFLSPPRFRSSTSAKIKIVDTTACREETLSQELKSLIAQKEKILLFINRRGLFTLTACRDCGKTVLCERCASPLVIHRSNKGNIFLCHKCQSKHEAIDKCQECGSWRLATLGVGIERVREELKDGYPDIKLIRIDSDSVKTSKQVVKLVQDFYNTPQAILLGTEMVLGFLDQPIENIAVVSVDSMLLLPDYRISEKIFHILIKLRELALANFTIQSRMSDNHLFQQVTTGNILEFYKNQIEERKKFGYPPFNTIIKVTNLKDKKMSVMKVNQWPDEKILRRLRKLSPSYNIEINPEYTAI